MRTPSAAPLVKMSDLSEQLGVGVSTLYRWLSEGRDLPPSIKLGHLRRWRQEDIDAWIERQSSDAA